MRKAVIRDDVEPLVVRGNSCTDKIRIRPVRSDCIAFQKYKENDNHASLVCISKRQWWTCYHYNVGEIGWVCERDAIYLRLSEDDFERIFGRIEVIDRRFANETKRNG